MKVVNNPLDRHARNVYPLLNIWGRFNEMNTILSQIVDNKREDIELQKKIISFDGLSTISKQQHPTTPFLQSLNRTISSGKNGVIAEIKKASPTEGVICSDLNLQKISEQYCNGGACCLSVLTEERFFQGNPYYIQLTKAFSSLPILRKDFIIDPYQVVESRCLGADAILLIASILDKNQLKELYSLAKQYDMDVLIEVHTKEDLDKALFCEPEMIGINNRNLDDFSIDLQTTIDLQKYIPQDCTVITESGITTKEGVEYFNRNGVNGFLVGETLVKENNTQQKLEELFF